MEEYRIPPITTKDKIRYKTWWAGLSDNWKIAFNVVMQKPEKLEDLTEEEMHSLWHSYALRFAGPKAVYPNLTFELGNLEGLKELVHLQTLVVINNGLTSIQEIKHLTNLKSLFVYENEIKRLNGIEKLTNIRELHIHNNKITSLEPLKGLTNLQTLYVRDNEIKSLKGIGKKHVAQLKNFIVLPNDKLPYKAINKMQNKIGIECKKG